MSKIKTHQNVLYGILAQGYPMDYCQICGAYDTIQTYFPSGKKKNGVPIWFHTCEKCAKEMSLVN